MSSSPYATGGGGVRFEQLFGAVALAALLTETAMPELSPGGRIVELRFQDATSPVDDLVVGEVLADGSARQTAIAIRHRPRFTQSDPDFVSLLASMLRLVADSWVEVEQGRLRICLVTASTEGPTNEVNTLAELARAAGPSERFREEVARDGRVTSLVRQRLTHLDAAVSEAASKLNDPTLRDPPELTWRLLAALVVSRTALEGDVAPDRVAAINTLQTICAPDQEPEQAFANLIDLAGGYATQAAQVTQATLRRDLTGRVRLKGTSSTRRAFELLAELRESLRRQTPDVLRSATGEELHLPRAEEADSLRQAIDQAANQQAVLVISGQPDVGKSALAIRVIDGLEAQGLFVLAMNLRDLPKQTLELASQLGQPLDAIFGSLPTASGRLLLIDGAEVAMEGSGHVLCDLVASARVAGLQPIVVSRDEAREAVATLLRGVSQSVKNHSVKPLAVSEVAAVAERFPVLSRMARDRRGQALLSRPGIAEALLRHASNDAVAFSEAEVYERIWRHGVRLDGVQESVGRNPDARENMLLWLANRDLGNPVSDLLPPDAETLAGLRIDGFLASQADQSFAWGGNDRFASDIIRDFAITCLIARRGLDVLRHATDSRSAIRATRIASQYWLGEGAPGEALVGQLASFGDLAQTQGDRWRDVPLEASLLRGDSADSLPAVWDQLIAEEGALLDQLIRIASQRFSQPENPQAVVVEPLIGVVLAHFEGFLDYGDLRERFDELVVQWLTLLALDPSADEPNAVRADLRDRLLLQSLGWRHDDWRLRCLALLGPDLDGAARAALGEVAASTPGELHECVERPAAIFSLAHHHPDLLLSLSEAYYIKQPRSGHERSPFGPPPDMDGGVRGHRHTPTFGPMAAWHFGPFNLLLQAEPLQTIAFINRLLDHAATSRASMFAEFGFEAPTDTGTDLPAPNGERHLFFGDQHSWATYRGTSVAPYPCTSALLALEVNLDSFHRQGAPLERLVAIALAEANSLAMLGLVIGLLTRHIDEVTTELDPWLAEPVVWDLEFNRATLELGGLRGADGAVDNPQWRRLTMREAASVVATNALRAHDQGRMAQLEKLADRLIERTKELAKDPTGESEQVFLARGWAACLRPSCYQLVERDGARGYMFEPPAELQALAAPRMELLEQSQEFARLLHTYSARFPWDGDPAQLRSDLELAKRPLPSEAHEAYPAAPARAAVAAAAALAHAAGKVTLDKDDLHFALDVLEAAMQPVQRDMEEVSGALFPDGPDRLAASALASLLSPRCWEQAEDVPFSEHDLARITDALGVAARHGVDEVRVLLATSLDPVWQAPCHVLCQANGRCRHQIAFEAVCEGLRHSVMGPLGEHGKRVADQLGGDLVAALGARDSGDYWLDRLAAALVALVSAQASDTCVSVEATALVELVLPLHARVQSAWSESHYHRHPDGEEWVGKMLLDLAGQGEQGSWQLLQYVDMLTEPEAIHDVLQMGLCCAATYDAARRKVLALVWPQLMASQLKALREGRGPWADDERPLPRVEARAVGALIPEPKFRTIDTDMVGTLAALRGDWVSSSSINDLVSDWISQSHHFPECLDDLLGYVGTLPEDEQQLGLGWVANLIADRYDRFASRSWKLPDWLRSLRAGVVLNTDEVVTYRRIVDGMVAAGDSRLLDLQQAEEGGA